MKYKVSFTNKGEYTTYYSMTDDGKKILSLVPLYDGIDLSYEEIFENIMPFCKVILSRTAMTCEVYNDYRE